MRNKKKRVEDEEDVEVVGCEWLGFE